MQAIEQDLDLVVAVAQHFLPEIILCSTAVIVILCSLFRFAKNWTFYATVAGIILHLVIIPSNIIRSVFIPTSVDILGNFENAIKLIAGIATLITVVISGTRQRMEYYLLIISVLVGAEILLMSKHFIMIILSMELISISSYVLTAGTDPDKQRAEAAWKFFLYGSVATAVMIFGMTYIFGATGFLVLPDTQSPSPWLLLGGIMMLGGFLFKMTAAPFHLWAPDVYEATPAPIVAFFSVVPKLAGFVIVVKWAASLNSTVTIAAIAILSIVVGTLAALNQTNGKRMMAYSSVAQAGFLLIIPASSIHFNVAIFYATVFAIMNYVVFIVIHENEKANRGTSYADFAGVGYSNPLVGVAITLGLISLAGLPPTAGFMAKLAVFSALWTKFYSSKELIFLVLFIVGLLATAASLYFYLKIPFYAFFRRSPENQPIKISLLTNLLLLILVGLLLALFLAPGLFDGLSY